MIRTERLKLILATPAHFDAIGQSDAALTELLNVTPAPGWLVFEDARAAMAGMGEWLAAHPEAARWSSCWFVHRAEAALIGLGGYKGAPTDGAVEIGYALAPSYRGRGLAREAVAALIEHAFQAEEVDRVVAHTLAEPNASTRLLQHFGLINTDTIDDPDDGTIWRWELSRSPADRLRKD